MGACGPSWEVKTLNVGLQWGAEKANHRGYDGGEKGAESRENQENQMWGGIQGLAGGLRGHWQYP